MGLASAAASKAPIDGALLLAMLVLVSAALHDIAFRTIPNWCSTVLCLSGVLIRVLGGTLVPGLTAGLLIFTAAAFCWWRGWLGGGDVKLLGATALVVPPALAVNLVIDTALLGGILAVFYLGLAQLATRPSYLPRARGLLRRICRAERYRISRRGPLPYGSAIAGGALIVLLRG